MDLYERPTCGRASAVNVASSFAARVGILDAFLARAVADASHEAAAEIHSPPHSPGRQVSVLMRHSSRFAAVSKPLSASGRPRGSNPSPFVSQSQSGVRVRHDHDTDQRRNRSVLVGAGQCAPARARRRRCSVSFPRRSPGAKGHPRLPPALAKEEDQAAGVKPIQLPQCAHCDTPRFTLEALASR